MRATSGDCRRHSAVEIPALPSATTHARRVLSPERMDGLGLPDDHPLRLAHIAWQEAVLRQVALAAFGFVMGFASMLAIGFPFTTLASMLALPTGIIFVVADATRILGLRSMGFDDLIARAVSVPQTARRTRYLQSNRCRHRLGRELMAVGRAVQPRGLALLRGSDPEWEALGNRLVLLGVLVRTLTDTSDPAKIAKARLRLVGIVDQMRAGSPSDGYAVCAELADLLLPDDSPQATRWRNASKAPTS